VIPNPKLDAVIATETFREMLETLTPSQFLVVCLRFDGMTNEEIAEALDIPISTVGRRLRRARARLKRKMPELASLLEGRFAEEGPERRDCR
jgi:RNA polymerase sigma factor (sigma-70 family)